VVRIANITSRAVIIKHAFNTLLFSSGTSGSSSAATVGIEQTFNTLFLGQRTSRSSSRAVAIGVASVRNNASGIGTALGSGSFGISPVNKGAVTIAVTFDAATSVLVAIRKTVIRALAIVGTVVYTDVGNSIAVRLSGDFTTIGGTTALSSSITSIATAIGSAVRGGARTISIDGTRTASSVTLATRLVRDMSTIENTAISVGCASFAGTISLAIVSAGVGLAVAVVVGVGDTSVRIHANSSSANSVGTHGVRAVIGGTVTVGNTRGTTTIFHAILSAVAGTIASTTRVADGVSADSITVVISAPVVVYVAISIISAIEANTVCHAVGTLSTRTLVVVAARINAKTRGLVAIYLASFLTSVKSSTSGGSVADGAV